MSFIPSWVELHGAITHFPIVFLLIAPAFDLGALILHKPVWRTVSLWLLAGAVAMAVPSLITGWITGNSLFSGLGDPPTLFVLHRLVAFTASGLALILLIWRSLARDRLTGGALYGSVLMSVVIAGMVGGIGFLGGRMVFGSGVGALGQSPDTEARKATKSPARAAGSPVVNAKLVLVGQQLFQADRCQSCHRIAGKGGRSGRT